MRRAHIVSVCLSLVALVACDEESTQNTGDTGADFTEADTAATDSSAPDTSPGDTSVADMGSLDTQPDPIVSVSVSDPSSPASGQIPIDYVLTDGDSDSITLEVSYAVDGGASQLATRAPGGEGLTGLASAPAGASHTFTWNSAVDIPEGANDVVITLVAMDDDGTSAPASTSLFTVANAPDNAPPVVVLTNLTGELSDTISVGYVISDAESDDADLTVEFSLDGTTFSPATEASSGSDGTTGLTTTTTGTAYTFVWDSGADLFTNSDAVRLRFTPSDAFATGDSATTEVFAVRNAGVGVEGLRITEIDVGDVDSVELYNGTGADLSLLDYRLRWTDTQDNTGTWILPNATLRDGERMLLVETGGTNDGTRLYFNDNIEWGQGDGGSAALIDPDDNGIDFVRWNGSIDVAPQWTSWSESASLPTPADFSVLARKTLVDTNTDADWCLQPPTPAAPEWGCLSDGLSSGVLISEVNLGDPDDHIELVNTGTEAVNVSNWVLRINGTLNIPIPPGVVEPGGRVVIVDDASGVDDPSDILVEQNMGWNLAESGSVALVDPEANGIDFVRWGTSSTLPPGPDGWIAGSNPEAPWLNAVSLSRDASDTDTDEGVDWCRARSSFRAPSEPCITPIAASSGLVINEVFMGSSDWLEIVNAGNSDVDIAHAFLRTRDPAVNTMALPAVVLASGERILIRENTGTATATVFYSGFNFAFSDTDPASADLLAIDGTGVDFVRWGGSSATAPSGTSWTESAALSPALDTESLSRVPDGTDSDADVDWCAAAPSEGTANGACN